MRGHHPVELPQRELQLANRSHGHEEVSKIILQGEKVDAAVKSVWRRR